MTLHRTASASSRFGNDPYPEMARSDRPFEQGDLTDWTEAMRTCRTLAKSLRTVILVAGASAMILQVSDKKARSRPVSIFKHARFTITLQNGMSVQARAGVGHAQLETQRSR